jgi:Bacterial Ig domain
MKSRKNFLISGSALALLALSGCGGGGSITAVPNTLNGTALTGAAMANATVTVKDSTGKVCITSTTNAQGAWSGSLANCGAAPYLIKAVGTDSAGAPVTYFSAATASDVNTAGTTTKTVNVSQLTDVIVKVLLKTDTPDSVPAATITSSVTPANLQTTSQNTLAALVPPNVLGTLGTGDIRTMTVVAGSGTGLDGLHDKVPVIEVTVSAGTLNVVATVTNVNANGATAVTATTVPTAAAPTAPLVPPPAGTVINNVSVTTPTAVASLTPEELVKGEVTQMLRDWDKVYAAGVPAISEGARAQSFTDACYLDDGHDKPLLLSRWADATDTIREGNKYRTGATRSNLNVLSTTFVTNADGTKTRTATVKYDVNYADGTVSKQGENKLIFGNSASLCAANSLTGGENKPSWRFAGNGRQVETNANPVNVMYKKVSLADGSRVTTNGVAVGDYRQNRLEFGIYDYRSKGYTYAVIKGQGLPASGIKLLMPFTLRTAAELQGKSSAYTNSGVMDNARICSYKPTATTTAWDANLADCQQYGGGSNYWSFNDAGLAALTVGTLYTFNVYKGDGWKTVNGHANVTPDLTYTDALPAVPYNAAQLNESGFGDMGGVGSTLSEVATMFRGVGGNASTSPINVDVTRLPAGANAMARRSMWAYSNGRVNSTDAYASLRQINRVYPNNTDASVAVPIPGKLAAMSAVSYAEVGFSSTDRNGRSINTIYFFQ